MKQIRTVNGVTTLSDDLFNHLQVPIELINALNAHRDTIIKRLLPGLEVYIQYRFERKLPLKHVDTIKDQLAYLRTRNVDCDNRFLFVVHNLQKGDSAYVGAGAVMEEIDEIIKEEISVIEAGTFRLPKMEVSG